MSVQASQTAYLALVDMANRTQAQVLPGDKKPEPQWRGIGFSLLGYRFMVAMDEVVELLDVPAYTAIPGTHSWVLGVANVRGRLLPIFDLAQFFCGQAQGAKHLRRVLVVEHNKLYAGLIVDAIHGMQQLGLEQTERTPDDLTEPFVTMIDGQILVQQEPWLVFNLQKLIKDTQFANAAAD